jgi:hypothetical protein
MGSTLPASIVQPVLTRQQLETSEARYIIGSGHLAGFALSHLSDSARARTTLVDDIDAPAAHGRPVLNFRQFCASVDPTQPVILATDDKRWLSMLCGARQSHILDIREFFLSWSFHAQEVPRVDVAQQAVISTIPRSGTYRIRYFLFALNELLKGHAAEPSPHRLFLYRISDWANAGSPYYLSHALQFLRCGGLQAGHFVPPGALCFLSNNDAVARIQEIRAARFAASCREYPALGAVSHPVRPWRIEPCAPTDGRSARSRYVLVARNIVDQIVSMLTYYELMVPICRRLGARNWSMTDYVDHCFNRCRAFVFSGLGGIVPLVLQRAVELGRSVADLALEGGLVESLIIDYALQTYSARFFEQRPSDRLIAKVFLYDEMRADEAGFFSRFVTYLRNAELDSEERALVERARVLTDKDRARNAELELGHSLSFIDGLQNVFRMDTHMTDVAMEQNDIRAVRMAVRSKVLRHRNSIIRRFVGLMTEFQAAEGGMMIHSQGAPGGEARTRGVLSEVR